MLFKRIMARPPWHLVTDGEEWMGEGGWWRNVSVPPARGPATHTDPPDSYSVPGHLVYPPFVPKLHMNIFYRFIINQAFSNIWREHK